MSATGLIGSLGDAAPDVHPEAWIAPGAIVIGRVRLGRAASVWYGSVLRADEDEIDIGSECNIQDLSCLHVDPGQPVVLEERASLGHRAMVHGAHVAAGALVGIGAIVLGGARIGAGTLVAAGTVVLPGTQVPAGVLFAGVPAEAFSPRRRSGTPSAPRAIAALDGRSRRRRRAGPRLPDCLSLMRRARLTSGSGYRVLATDHPNWGQGNGSVGSCGGMSARRNLIGGTGSIRSAMEVGAVRGSLDLRVHDRVALDEIELYSEVLSAVAASDGPLTARQLDEVLGVRPVAAAPARTG